MSILTILARATAASALSLSALALPALAESPAPAAHVAAGDIAWQEIGLPGVQLALAWGSEEAGDAVWLIRMAPGAALPRHAHTNDYWGLTISGTWVHVHEDGSETPSTAGDYALVKGGVFHADRCEGADACIGLLDFSGARDAIFPE